MARNLKQPNRLGLVNNTKAAASRIGCSPAVVQAAREAGCIAFRSDNRIDCDRLVEWLAENPQHVESEVDYGLEKALRERARRKITELQLGELEGRLVRKQDAADTMFRCIAAAKNALIGHRPTVAQRIAAITGGNLSQIDAILEDHHREFLTELHAGNWSTKCPACGDKGD